jgi:hypothetical protein
MMTPQERLDYLLEVIAEPSKRGRLTHAWVAENVSLAVADGVYAAINAVSVPTALRYVTGNGIDTTAELWKTQATAVSDAVESLAPFLVLLRDFELSYLPRWQSLGMSEPTIESVAAEMQSKAAMQAYRDLHSKWLVPVLDGGNLSFANLAAATQSMATELGEMV